MTSAGHAEALLAQGTRLLQEGRGDEALATLEQAEAAGAVTLNYGAFINTLINFLIVGFAIFMVIRAANRMMTRPAPAPAPTTRDCPFCLSAVALKATRCPHCTSELKAA